MSEKPISPRRQRMIEDMSVRNFVEQTRNDYIRHKTRHSVACQRTANKAIDPLTETCHFNQDTTRFSNRRGICGSLA